MATDPSPGGEQVPLLSFFHTLRQAGLPVSITEWLTLMEALAGNLVETSLTDFYYVCRALCVKTEAHYDLYDQCFAHVFTGSEAPATVHDELNRWLQEPLPPPQLSEAQRAALEGLDLDALRQQFEQRLKEQTERHDGGSHWIGTGGTSPFGHGGAHPTGVRLGGPGGGGSAAQVASQRLFRNLRHDRNLDIRQISVALKQLRRLQRQGPEILDVDASIDATAREAGDIQLVFDKERKNSVKLLLLMDVGGSMDPCTHLCEALFSAAHKAHHFKAFAAYYFHNCPYESLYINMETGERKPTLEVLADCDKDWLCMMVGDAAMHPYELTAPGGAIDYFHYNNDPGLVWLGRIAKQFSRRAWLNPHPPPYWRMHSTQLVRQHFPMFHLTQDGLEAAVAHLRGAATVA